MKIIYLILIIFISFNLSNQTEELSEKGVNMLKCFFLTKERIDIMYSIFEKLFKTTNPMELYELIAIAPKLIPIIKECTGFEIKLPFGSFQNNNILKNTKKKSNSKSNTNNNEGRYKINNNNQNINNIQVNNINSKEPKKRRNNKLNPNDLLRKERESFLLLSYNHSNPQYKRRKIKIGIKIRIYNRLYSRRKKK